MCASNKFSSVSTKESRTLSLDHTYDAAGKTPMSCSNGLKGLPVSKLMSILARSVKSDAKGAK